MITPKLGNGIKMQGPLPHHLPPTSPPTKALQPYSIGLSMDVIGEQLELTEKLLADLNDKLFVILGDSNIEPVPTEDDYPASSPLQDKLNNYGKSLKACNNRINHILHRINL